MPAEVNIKDLEVWFQDESRIGQQGSVSRTWYPKGQRPRLIKQQQFLSAYIFAAVCPLTNKSSAIVCETVSAEAMQIHLDFVSQDIQTHAVLLMDRAGWHVAKALEVPKNITIIYLPPYSPELNPTENCWEFIKSRFLKNRTYKNVEEIVNAACEAWNNFVNLENQIHKTCSRNWANIKQLI